jgi:hypothetical protein
VRFARASTATWWIVVAIAILMIAVMALADLGVLGMSSSARNLGHIVLSLYLIVCLVWNLTRNQGSEV